MTNHIDNEPVREPSRTPQSLYCRVKAFWWVALTVLGLALTPVASANLIPAFSFTDATFTPAGGFSLGVDFTAATDISVTHLGYYDRDGNGLNSSAALGIFDTLTAALVSGTSISIPSGTGGVLLGDGPQGFYRYIALSTPVTLTGGKTYRVAGVANNGYTYTNYVGLTSAPGITLGGGYYQQGSSLNYPNTLSPFNGQIYGGASFLFDSQVPEPATLALFGFGLAGLGWSRRKAA